MWDRDRTAAGPADPAVPALAAPIRDARGGGAEAAGSALRQSEARLAAAGIPFHQVFDLTEAMYEKIVPVGDWFLDLVESRAAGSAAETQVTQAHLRRQLVQVAEALLDLSIAEASRRRAGRLRPYPPGPESAPAADPSAAGASGRPDRHRAGLLGSRGFGRSRVRGRP